MDTRFNIATIHKNYILLLYKKNLDFFKAPLNNKVQFHEFVSLLKDRKHREIIFAFDNLFSEIAQDFIHKNQRKNQLCLTQVEEPFDKYNNDILENQYNTDVRNNIYHCLCASEEANFKKN